MGEPVLGQAQRAHGRGRVAAADDAERALPVASTIACATPRVPSANGASSNTPIGPFQNTVFAPARTCANAVTDSGPMSRPFHPSGIFSTGTVRCSPRPRSRRRPPRRVGSTILPPTPAAAGSCDLVLLQQRVTHSEPLRREEGEAHPAADQQRVDLRQQRLDHQQLVRHLRPAEHHRVRPLRVVGQLAQHLDLALRPARRRRPAARWRRRRPTPACGARRRTRRRRTRPVPVSAASSPASAPRSASSLLVSRGSKRMFSSSTTPPSVERARPPRRPRRRGHERDLRAEQLARAGPRPGPASTSRCPHRAWGGRGAPRRRPAHPRRAAPASWAPTRGSGRRR